MKITTNVDGEHNGEKFSLVDGLLNIYGTRISLNRLKTIVEVVTLLKAQGYEVREKYPRYKPFSIFDQLHGLSPEMYDDDDTESK